MFARCNYQHHCCQQAKASLWRPTPPFLTSGRVCGEVEATAKSKAIRLLYCRHLSDVKAIESQNTFAMIKRFLFTRGITSITSSRVLAFNDRPIRRAIATIGKL